MTAANDIESANDCASGHSLQRVVGLRWERLADGFYKAGRYSAIRIRNRYSFRVDGKCEATGMTLNQCKLEAKRREQPNVRTERQPPRRGDVRDARPSERLAEARDARTAKRGGCSLQ